MQQPPYIVHTIHDLGGINQGGNYYEWAYWDEPSILIGPLVHKDWAVKTAVASRMFVHPEGVAKCMRAEARSKLRAHGTSCVGERDKVSSGITALWPSWFAVNVTDALDGNQGDEYKIKNCASRG